MKYFVECDKEPQDGHNVNGEKISIFVEPKITKISEEHIALDYLLLTTKPEIFGEALREYAFVGEGLGCYSTFELKPEFKEVDKTSQCGINMILLLDTFEHSEDTYIATIKADNPEFYDNCKLFSNDKINIGWYWEGDGTLLVMYGDKAAINTDCKKISTWSWL